MVRTSSEHAMAKGITYLIVVTDTRIREKDSTLVLKEDKFCGEEREVA